MNLDIAGVPSVQTGFAIVNSRGQIWCDVLFQSQDEACQYFAQHWKGDPREAQNFRLAGASQVIEILQTKSKPSYLSPPLSEIA
ncbi:hypothetical protein ACVIGB_008374 [Bradyrhizobium sp. USDA 4341]